MGEAIQARQPSTPSAAEQSAVMCRTSRPLAGSRLARSLRLGLSEFAAICGAGPLASRYAVGHA